MQCSALQTLVLRETRRRVSSLIVDPHVLIAKQCLKLEQWNRNCLVQENTLYFIASFRTKDKMNAVLFKVICWQLPRFDIACF